MSQSSSVHLILLQIDAGQAAKKPQSTSAPLKVFEEFSLGSGGCRPSGGILAAVDFCLSSCKCPSEGLVSLLRADSIGSTRTHPAKLQCDGFHVRCDMLATCAKAAGGCNHQLRLEAQADKFRFLRIEGIPQFLKSLVHTSYQMQQG